MMPVEDVLRMINREPKSFLLRFVFSSEPISPYEAEKSLMADFGYDPQSISQINSFRKDYPSLSHGSIEDFIGTSLYKAVRKTRRQYFIPQENAWVQNVAGAALQYAAEEGISMFEVLSKNRSCYHIVQIIRFLEENNDVSLSELVHGVGLSWGTKTRHLERLARIRFVEFDHRRPIIRGRKIMAATMINLAPRGMRFLRQILDPIAAPEYVMIPQPALQQGMAALQHYLGIMTHPEDPEFRKGQILSLLQARPMTHGSIREEIGVRVYQYLDDLARTGLVEVDKTTRPYVYKARLS